MTPASTDLAELIERVKGATEGLDDETLGRVLCLCAGVEFEMTYTSCGDDGSDELRVEDSGRKTVETYASGGYRLLCPDRSLDAALALVGARLPGWKRAIGEHRSPGNGGDCWRATLTDPAQTSALVAAWGPTAPLAVCLALLSALTEQA